MAAPAPKSLNLEHGLAVFTNALPKITKGVDQNCNEHIMLQVKETKEHKLIKNNGIKCNGSQEEDKTLNIMCMGQNQCSSRENIEKLRNKKMRNSPSAETNKKNENLPSGRNFNCGLKDFDNNNSGDLLQNLSLGFNGKIMKNQNNTISDHIHNIYRQEQNERGLVSLEHSGEQCKVILDSKKQNGKHERAKEIGSLGHRRKEKDGMCIMTSQTVDDTLGAPGGGGDSYTPPSGRTQLPNVKDKGYAWVTIAVMSLCNLVTNGYMRSSGLICGAVADAFPGTSTAHISLIISLLSSCRNISAPLVGAASVHFGFRPVMLLGVIICSGALFLSAFCNSVTTLVFTLGAMMGTGMGVLETPHVQVLSHYFHEKKELADSMRVSANPVGGIILPILLVTFIEEFGLKVAFILLSAIMLQLLVFVCLVRPYRTHQIIVYFRQLSDEAKTAAVQPQHQTARVPEELESVAMLLSREQDERRSSMAKETKAKKFDLKLFTNPVYYTYIVMICCWALAFPHTFYFLPMYGRSANLSARELSFIVTYQSIFDFFCRLVTGFLLNRKMFGKRTCFFWCLLIGGAGIVGVPFCKGVKTLLAAVSLVSLCCSGFFTCLNALLLDEFGRENIASSYGFMRMIQGIIVLIIPPFLGLLVDVTGDYTATFLVMGAGVVLAGISIAVQPLVADCSANTPKCSNEKSPFES